MTALTALDFTREWEAAWNRRDLEAVLVHFHDDVVFTSPVAKHVGFTADGVVRGKSELRRYWTMALAQNRELRFEVSAVYEGMNTFVIAFKTQNGTARTEVLTFKDGLVIEGHGTFAAS